MSSPPPDEDDVVAGENGGEEVDEGAEDSGSPHAVEEDGEQQYVVEKILDEMLDETGELQYNIRWEGYDSSGDTWEPFDNIKQCTDIIATWEATKAARAKKSGIQLSKAMG